MIPHRMLLTTPLQENNYGSPSSLGVKLSMHQGHREGLLKSSLGEPPQSLIHKAPGDADVAGE